MNAVGWVDFSSGDREKVRQVLAGAREPGTLDELGIGQLRDAFANTLFPGISTIQTRAKYFILVPRLLWEIESGLLPDSTDPLQWLEEQENQIAQLLVTRHGGAEGGIIGSESVHSGGVKRHPSSVYWNGLKVLGILHTELSLRELCQRLAAGHSGAGAADDLDAELAAGADQRRASLIDLPDGQRQWRDALSIHLTAAEAGFLWDKLSGSPQLKNSVLAQLLRQGGLAALVNPSGQDDVSFPDLDFDSLTELLLVTPGFSARCREAARQAQSFGRAIRGAHIRYNRELARRNGHTSYMEELEALFEEWLADCRYHDVFTANCVDDWLAALNASRINGNSLRFLRDWCRLVHEGAGVAAMDRLVSDRAVRTKGQRSQLYKKFSEPGWVGIDSLDYRWGVASTLLQDIEEASHA